MTEVLSRAPFDPRTWDSWFGDAPPRVQRAAIGRLDQFFGAKAGTARVKLLVASVMRPMAAYL
ncbi:MAG TPA: hypothetical protein PKJ50_12085, partial [Casimicrobium huifangae]|nr:hypothetical protein [Casimicrobium huifangae]